jgi:hypothetical protein
MSETTTYIVRTKYEVQGAGNSARQIDNVGRSADRAARSGGQLKSMLLGVFGAAGAVGGLSLAKKTLIDFNSGLENSKQTMAGLFMMNQGGTFEGQFAKANTFVDSLLIRAKETSATMSELSAMGRDVTASVTAAGGGMKTLENITVGAAVAAKALGREQGDAAREIGQMVGGRVEAVDTFGRQLLRSVGFADYQKFNKLAESERLKLTEKALNQPALKAMAKAQSESFSGVMSTLQDNLQISLGKVGLPLMQEITKEVKQWNAWIDQHPEKIKALVKDVGAGLRDGFLAVKQAVMWIADNREILMALAKAAMVIKGGSIVGNLIGGAGGAIGGMTGGMKLAETSAKGFAGAMGSASAKMGQFASIAAITYAGASFIADRALAARDREIAERTDVQGNFDYALGKSKSGKDISNMAAMSRFQDAMASGLLKRGADGKFEVDREKLALGAGRQDDFGRMAQFGMPLAKSNDELAVETQLLRFATQAATGASERALKTMEEIMIGRALATSIAMAQAGIERGQGIMARTGHTNIHIAKVEVPAKDPDRWIHTLVQKTQKQAKAPSRARQALRGGGA